jgi:hypothetical protein
MAFTKRQMLFLPEINPDSFVFFFERGGSGWSWSIRDYSVPNHVSVRRPTETHQSTDYLLQNALYAFNAPAHDTNDLAFRHDHTTKLNGRYGLVPSARTPRTRSRKPPGSFIFPRRTGRGIPRVRVRDPPEEQAYPASDRQGIRRLDSAESAISIEPERRTHAAICLRRRGRRFNGVHAIAWIHRCGPGLPTVKCGLKFRQQNGRADCDPHLPRTV